MIIESGTRKKFKRCLLRSVLMMECSGCGDEEVAELAGLKKNLVRALFICEKCQPVLKAREDNIQGFHVSKYRLLPMP